MLAILPAASVAASPVYFSYLLSPRGTTVESQLIYSGSTLDLCARRFQKQFKPYTPWDVHTSGLPSCCNLPENFALKSALNRPRSKEKETAKRRRKMKPNESL